MAKEIPRKLCMWCDGAIKNNGNKDGSGLAIGGIGVIFTNVNEESDEVESFDDYSMYYIGPTDQENENAVTNNRMELYAFLEGLKYYINTYEFTQKTVLTVFSDSAYLVNGITKFLPNWIRRGWKTTDKKPLKNLDIWLQINDIIEDKDNRPKLVVKHVKGHNGNKFQEMSDRLAVKAVEDAVVVVD